jgi:hypothetical protein
VDDAVAMDSQILAFLGLLAFLCLGLWLMFGRLGNKKPSGDNPEQFHSDGRINPDQ